MGTLKSLFPISFVAKEKNANSLGRSILLYAVIIIAYFIASGVLGFLFGDVIAWLMGLIGTLVGLYSTCGIVLSILCYCGIAK